jgi:hypothetical protein
VIGQIDHARHAGLNQISVSPLDADGLVIVAWLADSDKPSSLKPAGAFLALGFSDPPIRPVLTRLGLTPERPRLWAGTFHVNAISANVVGDVALAIAANHNHHRLIGAVVDPLAVGQVGWRFLAWLRQPG